jgi:hypothetical protein
MTGLNEIVPFDKEARSCKRLEKQLIPRRHENQAI